MTIRVTALHCYPIKGLRGHAVPAVDVERCGFAGDRRWMLVDAQDRFLTQRQYPVMARVAVSADADGLVLQAEGVAPIRVARPGGDAVIRPVTVWRDTVPAAFADAAAGDWLQQVLGIECRLVHMHDPQARSIDPAYSQPGDYTTFSDGFPVLLASEGSLDDLNWRLASPVPMQRFRPNLVVGGASAWAEDRWRRIRIGAVVFRLAKPCSRCLVTSIDQQSGERPEPREPLRTLGTFRRDRGGAMFGQNLIPDTLGRIAVGDTVSIEEAGEPNVTHLEAQVVA